MFKGRHLSGIEGGDCGWLTGGGNFISLLYNMFQSTLNTFVFGFFWWKKINYFHGWGVPPPPSRKIPRK